MMDRGVYLPCSQFEAAFTCAAMTDDHIDQTIRAAAESLEALSKQ
jgi:glutamate-1-semialdehyde 2,1-aminomutase